MVLARLLLGVASAECPDALADPTAEVCASPGCCSEPSSTPCFSDLQEAVDAAATGDNILVKGGTYRQRVVVEGKAIALKAEGDTSRLTDPLDAGGTPLISVNGVGAALTVRGVVFDVAENLAVSVTGGCLRFEQVAVNSTYGGRLDAGSAFATSAVLATDAELSIDGSLLFGGTPSFGVPDPQLIGLVGYTSLDVVDSVLEGSPGGVVVGSQAPYGTEFTVTLRGTDEANPTRISGNGGSRSGVVSGRGALTVTGAVVFENNEVPSMPAGVLPQSVAGCINWIGDVHIDGATFRDNVAPTAAVLSWGGRGALTLERTLMCRNGGTADASETLVAAVTIGSMNHDVFDDTVLIRNNRFFDNTGAIAIGSVVAPEGPAEPIVRIEHNHFVGNVAIQGAVLRADATPDPGWVRFVHNVVAFNQDLAAQLDLATVSPVDARGNLWWQNLPSRDIRHTLDGAALEADPLLQEWQGDCNLGLEGRALGRPSYYGPTVDAGTVPLLSDTELSLDPDGSPPDLGAWGGAEADPERDDEWSDEDGDGMPLVYDCGPLDAAIRPEVEDVPYNGVDADCRGDDDYDGDHDGAFLPKWTPEGDDGPYDCDDEDARRAPGHAEVPGNGVDDDCDGWADEGAPLVPAGCGTAGGPAVPVSISVAAWALRRRRRSAGPTL